MLDLNKKVTVNDEFIFDLMRNKKLGKKIVEEVQRRDMICGEQDCTQCPHNRAEFIRIMIDRDIRKEREKREQK